MRTGSIPISAADAATVIAIEMHADGTATLYEVGDLLPAHMVPSPPATDAITDLQIRLALSRMGLRAAVEAAVEGGSQDLRDYWDRETVLHRDNPLVVQMAQAIGVAPAQVDALWTLGTGL